MTDEKIPNKWASAVCVSRSMMGGTNSATGFGLTTLSDEVMEYCSQITDALASGSAIMDIDDEDW